MPPLHYNIADGRPSAKRDPAPFSVRVDGRDPYLSIQAVNVFVRDQERSLRFYREKLGFSLAGDVRLESGDRWVAVAPPDGTALISLIAPKPGSKACELIGRSSPVVFVTEDFPATFREWRKRGVRFRHVPRLRRVKYLRKEAASISSNLPAPPTESEPVWGGVFTRFEDVNGNSFALVSYDEVSRAVEAQRRAAADKLEAERRAAQEFEIAKQVQARLFPQTSPPMRTLEYAGTCIQARQVGGDYYDFLDLGRDRLGLVLGDTSGKGIAAALLMANLQANLRSQCAVAVDQPQRLLQSVNQLFCENTADTAFATLFFGEYNDRNVGCATPIAGTFPPCFCGATTLWNDWKLQAPCWASSRTGNARSRNTSFSRATPFFSTRTASRNRLTRAVRSSESSAFWNACGAIATWLPRPCSPRLWRRSASSALTSSTTISR